MALSSHSVPIALPHNNSNNNDYNMASGSYTGSNGSFNPASYARQFMGSPIEWRAGSFGSRFPTGSPTAQLLNSFDPKLSSSSDSDRSLLNALSVFDREGELCRNYTCCGLHLNDLHALLEHFEEVHIVVLDPTAAQPQAHIQIPFNPQPNPPDQPTPTQTLQQQSQYFPQQPQPYATSFDPDEMELEIDLDSHLQPQASAPQSMHPSAHSSPSSGGPTPPDTPISTPSSAMSPNAFMQQHHQIHSPYTSQPPSPPSMSSFDSSDHTRRSSADISHRPNLNLNLAAFPRQSNTGSSILPEDAFNSYSRFSNDFNSCLPQYNSGQSDESTAHHNFVGSMAHMQSPHFMQQQGQQQHQLSTSNPKCLPPALLFSGNTTPCSTPSTSRVPSPTSQYASPFPPSQSQSPISSVPSTPISPTGTPQISRHSSASSLAAAASRPTSSLLLSKPFRCPKPNCNKSYKQANGLKYHITHGSCNFAPPKDLEHVKDLLERKRRDREAAAANGEAGGLARSASLGQLGSTGGASGPQPEPFLGISAATSAYGDLSSITETELREVEREAERRLRPFACGVGDCQRRYKNMNGLRYHYQHSGDHGAVGLALLASGQHECLPQGSGSANAAAKRTGAMTPQGTLDREGRRKVAGPSRGGSVSVPVSRAGSKSRTGTPAPPTSGMHPQYLPSPNAMPFSPPTAQSQASQAQQQQQQHMAYQQQYANLQRQQYAMQQHHLQQQQQHQQAIAQAQAEAHQQTNTAQSQFSADVQEAASAHQYASLYSHGIDSTMTG